MSLKSLELRTLPQEDNHLQRIPITFNRKKDFLLETIFNVIWCLLTHTGKKKRQLKKTKTNWEIIDFLIKRFYKMSSRNQFITKAAIIYVISFLSTEALLVMFNLILISTDKVLFFYFKGNDFYFRKKINWLKEFLEFEIKAILFSFCSYQWYLIKVFNFPSSYSSADILTNFVVKLWKLTHYNKGTVRWHKRCYFRNLWWIYNFKFIGNI